MAKKKTNICELNPDSDKICSCRQKKSGKWICDVFDEQLGKLKRCPLK